MGIVAWQTVYQGGPGEAAAAEKLAAGKRNKYARAMKREMERTGRERIKFWPLAFEATGGWGKDMELFFKLCTNAVTRTRGKAELWHWSAMDFGKHWKQLMGVTIGRGRAECATAAVRAGRSATSAGAVAEYSPYSV